MMESHTKIDGLIPEDEFSDIKKSNKNLADELVKKMIRGTKISKPERRKEDIITIRTVNRTERITVKQMQDMRIAVDKYKSKLSGKTEDEMVDEYLKRRKKNKNSNHLDLLNKDID